MTATAHRPDLRRLGESAFIEVLGSLLSLPATVWKSADERPLSAPLESITSQVLLAGPLLSGSIHLQFPQAFIAHAVRLLTGLDSGAGNASELRDDAAGELANMVAGRVAARLAADGYTCQLSIPSISHRARSLLEIHAEADYGRTELLCEGHWLLLEIQCRYAAP